MGDGVVDRILGLARGTIAALAEAAVSAFPDAVAKGALRDADAAVEEARAELGRAVAAHRLALSRLAETQRRHAGLGAKVALALRERRDDLAAAAVAAELDAEAELDALIALAQQRSEAEAALEQLLSLLVESRRRMREAVARQGPGEGVPLRAESLLLRMERASDALGRALGPAAGLADASPDADHRLLAELDALDRQRRIDERLALARRSLGADRARP